MILSDLEILRGMNETLDTNLQRAVDRQPWSPRGWLVESSQHARLRHTRQIAMKMCDSNWTCDITIRVRLQWLSELRSHSKETPLRNHYCLKTHAFSTFFENVKILWKILKPWPSSIFGHRFFPDLSLGMNEVTYLFSTHDDFHEDLRGIERDITIFVTKIYK